MTPSPVYADPRRRRHPETGGTTATVLMVSGALLLAVSLVLTLGTVGGTTHRTVAATVRTSTSTPPQSAAAFLDELASAMRTGDVAFMVSRLNAAVINRYGDGACRAAAATYTDPTAAFVVTSTSPPGTYRYRAADRTTEIPDTVTAKATFTHDGQPVPVVVHLSRTGNGMLSWFTDCLGPNR